MQDANASRTTVGLLSKRTITIALVMILMVPVVMYAIRFYQASQASVLPPDTVTISQSVLEERYGVKVNLLAVTAAGGFVDLRLKILDGGKARALLEDPDGFPSLVVDNSIQLSVSQDAKERGIDFENSHTLFVMFPNSGNFIRHGTPVTILFGDIALEPVEAQ